LHGKGEAVISPGEITILHDLEYGETPLPLDIPEGRIMGQMRRSEEPTSALQSRFGISYAVFCLKKKKNYKTGHNAKHAVM